MPTELAYSKNRSTRRGLLVRDVFATLGRGESLHFQADDDEGLTEQVRALPAAIAVVDWWRGEHARPLAKVNAGLRYYVKKVGVAEPEVTQRLKRFSTIVDKLQREPTMKLSKMEDIGGVRVILPKQEQISDVRADLERQSRWNIRRVRDYVDGSPGPKDDGYRAVHVIVEKDGCYVEVQLRTPWQDAWAQSVEQDTRRLRAGLEFGSGPGDLREYYRMTSELFAMRERHEQPSQEFMEELAKSYAATRRYFPDPDGKNQSSR